MKKCLSLILIFVILLGAVSCSSPETPAGQPEKPEAGKTETEKDEEKNKTEDITGDDWRTLRNYTEDFKLSKGLTVCLSRADDDSGYAVYDSFDGEQIGILPVPRDGEGFFDGEILIEKYDGDDILDIGIVLGNGRVQWYSYNPDLAGTWPEDFGPFEALAPSNLLIPPVPEEWITDDLTCYPYEEPGLQFVTEDTRAMYDEVLQKVLNYEPFYYDVATYGYEFMDNLLLVTADILNSHLETRCYFETREVDDEEGNLTGIESAYTCKWEDDNPADIEKVREGMARFDETCDNIVSSLTSDMTAYEKYLYLASRISQNAEFDYSNQSFTDSTPWGGIMGGWAICEGYSAAMTYLCKRADLYCRMVEGAVDNEGHAWNLIRLPQGTYYVDVTWADCEGVPGEESWMHYFAMTQEEIEAADHVVADGTVATGK